MKLKLLLSFSLLVSTVLYAQQYQLSPNAEISVLTVGPGANLNDAFCYFKGNELYIKNMFIAEYELGTAFNHEPRRLRKLLLRSGELNKLQRKVKEKGFTIIPYRLYINQRGLAKLEIALAQGKNTYDKRDSIKAKDQAREMDRIKKIRLAATHLEV